MKNPVKTLAVIATFIVSVSSASMASETKSEVGASVPGVVSTQIEETSQIEEPVSPDESNQRGENFCLRCEALLEHENYKGLFEVCDEAIIANSKNTLAYVYRAVARYYLDESQDAVLADLNLAVDSDPNCSAAYLARAGFFEITNQIELAISDYKAILALEPDNVEVLGSLINRNVDLKNWNAVVESCGYWISIAPTEPAPYYLRAMAEVELGDTAAAIEDLEETSKLLVALKRNSESDQVKGIIAELKNGNSGGLS
jgi:tetratricopeptide (TPR) repeat protein